MEYAEAMGVVARLYEDLLERTPGTEEQQQWAQAMLNGVPLTSVIDKFRQSDEFKLRHRVVPFFPPGHYYSPIVDPDANVRRYLDAQSVRVGAQPQQISIDIPRMYSFFRQNVAVMAAASWGKPKTKGTAFMA